MKTKVFFAQRLKQGASQGSAYSQHKAGIANAQRANTHYSVALKYDKEESEAPIVLAKGVNEVALRIRELAKDNDIILFENPPLARSLYDTVEIEEEIPEELYKAVAEVISYVYKKKGKIK